MQRIAFEFKVICCPRQYLVLSAAAIERIFHAVSNTPPTRRRQDFGVHPVIETSGRGQVGRELFKPLDKTWPNWSRE
jgi:hypothetical protein